MKDSNTNSNDSKKNLPGIWLGIDLGTTNTTAAFFSPNKYVSKLIRFTPPYASIQKKNDKFGKILPSAVYYENGLVESIGKSALVKIDEQNKEREGKKKQANNFLLTSVKRIWGMDTIQIKDEISNDESFLDSCPFQTTWVNDELRIIVNGEHSENPQDHEGEKQSIIPIEIAELLLSTIRKEANAYFMRERRKKKHYPLGYQQLEDTNGDEEKLYNARHCIITIPAHFSRKQRDKIIQAARNAGFDGYINTLVESTAAAMAYGLFVSPTKVIQQPSTRDTNDDDGAGDGIITKQEGRKILVCDMGGGTTDITIAHMIPNCDKTNRSANQDPSFQVLATAGERRLGGDDMDTALAQFVSKEKMKIGKQSNKKEWNKLLSICRNAKESICGDGKDLQPKSETTLIYGEHNKIVITKEEFDSTIEYLVDKVARLVDKTLKSCQCTYESIDEVILVGGATRTPAIRTMLQNKFKKNELCYSIDADAAVAQGAAIQCAIVSGLVPKHELRNAMMLDALPHTIGVLVSSGDDGETYIPILESGMALPAMNYASFQLADVRQKGVTIVAVEDVGEELPLQRVGQFSFLLHRLLEDELQLLNDGKRMIDVGMTVDTDAKFIVSIFDKNDPDDLEKKKRYQEWKRRQKEDGNTKEQKVYMLDEKEPSEGGEKKTSRSFAREEIVLAVCCISLFFLYTSMRLLFHEPGQEL